jgi:putative two-component system response regulator
VDLSNWRILSPDDTQTILGDSDRSQVVIGTATWLRSGRHFVAAQYIPSMKARLVVQQPESGLLAFGEAVASGAMLSATFLGAVILMLTGTISFVLIRRHNRVLSEINQGLESEVARRVGENLATRHSLIIGLAKLAESRDSDTGEHLDRICSYAEILARQLSRTRPEITEHWLADLRLAATLHDIGKVGVPDVVLNKPGKFDARERAVMERHPLIGAETLEAVRNRMGSSDLLDLSIDIARHHHERWDGTGYPDGLKGPQIPIAARIIAVADVYDALTSPRVYKPAISHSESVRIISGGRGTHFDPEVVDAFEAVADEFDRVRSTFRFPDAAQNPPVARLAA